MWLHASKRDIILIVFGHFHISLILLTILLCLGNIHLSTVFILILLLSRLKSINLITKIPSHQCLLVAVIPGYCSWVDMLVKRPAEESSNSSGKKKKCPLKIKIKKWENCFCSCCWLLILLLSLIHVFVFSDSRFHAFCFLIMSWFTRSEWFWTPWLICFMSNPFPDYVCTGYINIYLIQS